MIQQLAYEIVENKQANIIDLLNELRQDLRRELNLEEITTQIKIFRVKNKNEKPAE